MGGTPGGRVLPCQRGHPRRGAPLPRGEVATIADADVGPNASKRALPPFCKDGERLRLGRGSYVSGALGRSKRLEPAPICWSGHTTHRARQGRRRRREATTALVFCGKATRRASRGRGL